MEVLGIDVGFGFTKASNGKKSIIFKSIIGDSTDIQFQSDFGDTSFSSNLHVSIEDSSYFIGDFAELQSNVRQFTLDQDRLLSEFIKVLALTAAGQCSETDGIIHLVSGLPVGYLKRDFQRFIDTLKGRHKITYHYPNGKENVRNVNIQNVQMMPQPIGSIFHLLMDENGRLTNTELSKQKIGVVDIGFRTTDFSVFDRLQYIERGSSTMETGISKCFSIIANKLRQESGVDVELFRLYKAVKAGYIKIKGREYSITNLRDKVYAHTAGAMANDINRLWADEWDMDAIILTGGGSMELAKFLIPLLEGNIFPVESNVDQRFNNVMGYLKYAKYKWGHAINPETTSQPSEPPPPPPTKSNKSPEEAAQKSLKWMKRN